jgi:hypothetical protein
MGGDYVHLTLCAARGSIRGVKSVVEVTTEKMGGGGGDRGDSFKLVSTLGGRVPTVVDVDTGDPVWREEVRELGEWGEEDGDTMSLPVALRVIGGGRVLGEDSGMCKDGDTSLFMSYGREMAVDVRDKGPVVSPKDFFSITFDFLSTNVIKTIRQVGHQLIAGFGAPGRATRLVDTKRGEVEGDDAGGREVIGHIVISMGGGGGGERVRRVVVKIR